MIYALAEQLDCILRWEDDPELSNVLKSFLTLEEATYNGIEEYD